MRDCKHWMSLLFTAKWQCTVHSAQWGQSLMFTAIAVFYSVCKFTLLQCCLLSVIIIFLFTLPPVFGQSMAVSLSVYLSVCLCLSNCISLTKTTFAPNFLYMVPVVVAQSYCGISAVSCGFQFCWCHIHWYWYDCWQKMITEKQIRRQQMSLVATTFV